MSEPMYQAIVGERTGIYPVGTPYGEILTELAPEKISDTMLILDAQQ